MTSMRVSPAVRPERPLRLRTIDGETEGRIAVRLYFFSPPAGLSGILMSSGVFSFLSGPSDIT